jgi:hypothetical protein
MPVRSMTPSQPVFRISARRSNSVYASWVRISVRVARMAAIVSGLPLNVPTWSILPDAIQSITASEPPIAPHGRPPPTDLARHSTSGVTPNRSTAPP